MFDQPLLLQTLSRFAGVLPGRHDLEAVMSDLAQSLTEVLSLSGSQVAIADLGRLSFVTALTPYEELCRVEEDGQVGPCRDAYDTGEVVRVADVRRESSRWPDFAATAIHLGVVAVAGIPVQLDEKVIGALGLYSTEPREWSDEDIAVAGVLADVATSCVLNASKLRQQEQISEQLQGALDSRVVIEQAKGITAHENTITVDHAYALMRKYARSEHASIRVIAEEIVARSELATEPTSAVNALPTPADPFSAAAELGSPWAKPA